MPSANNSPKADSSKSEAKSEIKIPELKPELKMAIDAVKPTSDAPKPSEDLAKPADPDAKAILIAEDDPFISRMYQIKLEAGGFRVIVKNNGRDAFEAIKSEHPNLAVLDINMPELSGLEVLAALQNDGFDFSGMPVIVLTNSSEMADRTKARSFGAEYLVKAELTPRQVLDMISQKLGLDPSKK